MTSFKTPLIALCISGLTIAGCATPSTSSTDANASSTDPSVAAPPITPPPPPIDSHLATPVMKPGMSKTPSTRTTPAPLSLPAPAPSAAKAVSITPVNATIRSTVKPILRSGTDINIAAEGFRTPEQFVAVARAARNLDIPFMPLKHDVLDRHMTLAQAIHAYKPNAKATLEADRAMAEARAAIAEERATRMHEQK